MEIINKSKHELPKYETILSAGMDLRANLDKSITISPMGRSLIPTGLFIALSAGLEAQIRPRSGLAYKKGITVLNAPGTIDADGHILEPIDLWENYLEKQYKDRALRIDVDDQGYEYLEIDQQPSLRSRKGSLGLLGAMGQEDMRPSPERRYSDNMPFGSCNADERLDLMTHLRMRMRTVPCCCSCSVSPTPVPGGEYACIYRRRTTPCSSHLVGARLGRFEYSQA